jgi:hypothetical protein
MPSMPIVLALALFPGCIESPQTELEYPAFAVNDASSTFVVADWTIALTRADFAFGPVYFCASASASSGLCASSIAEIANVVTIDGLSGVPVSLGAVRGLSGTIRSASYDFGISWFDTTTRPTVAAGAPLGHSLRIEAEARRGSERVSLTANVDVVPQSQGRRAVPTASVCEAGKAAPGAVGCPDVQTSDYRLEVRFDVAAWLRQLDFDAMAASGQKPFAIEPGTSEHNTILVGIRNLAPAAFHWVPNKHN